MKIQYSPIYFSFTRCEMKMSKRLTLLLLAFAISISLVITTHQTASAAVEKPENCTKWHTVKQGEYLSKIAELYDTNWYSLASINRMSNPSLIYPNQKICIFYSGYTYSPPANTPTGSTSTTVFAISVKEDSYVTVQGKNLSAETRYSVYLNKYYGNLESKILVGSASTDKSGSFKGTYTIPKKLYDVMKISLIVTSPRGSSTSNWFINATSSNNVGGINSPKVSVSILSVKKDKWVKINVKNLPTNVTFKVYINKLDASMRKAVEVGTIRGTKNDLVSDSFDIPGTFKDLSNLEIFVINNNVGISAEAQFNNKTTN